MLLVRSHASCGLAGQVLFGSGLVACLLPEALVKESFLGVARGKGSSPKFLEKRRAKKWRRVCTTSWELIPN